MAMARYSGVTLVCVLLGDKVPTSGTKGTKYDKIIANRFLEAKNLFEYGYSYLFPLVNVRTLKDEGLPVAFEGAVQKGEETLSVPTMVEDVDAVVSMYLPARQALQEKDRIRAQISQPMVTVPVAAGAPAGEVSYFYEDRLLFTLPLVFQYGLEPDPTPSPAPILQVEKRPLPSAGETEVPVQEIQAEPDTAAQPSTKLLWYILLPLLLVSAVFVLCLMRRRKR